MDKATGFRAAMILVAALVLFALISIYRNTKTASERFSASTAISSTAAPVPLAPGQPSYATEQYPWKSSASPKQVLTPTAGADPVAAAVLPSEPDTNEQFRAVDFPTGVAQPADPSPSRRLTTEDLLPKDAANSKWAQVTPSGQGELRDLNFMTAGWHIGVNTQGQSLRNPNLQLRSDPINPQYKVSPWNMSTVEPDVSRRPFEMI